MQGAFFISHVGTECFCSIKICKMILFFTIAANHIAKPKKQKKPHNCAIPSSGAEGGTRTLAPVTRPTPLAGAPRHQLEYFCIDNKILRYIKTAVWRRGWDSNPCALWANGFQDRLVMTASIPLHDFHNIITFIKLCQLFIFYFNKKLDYFQQ